MPDVHTFIEVAPGIKARLRTAIEALVDVLDSLEPDVDIEENGDDELTTSLSHYKRLRTQFPTPAESRSSQHAGRWRLLRFPSSFETTH